MSQRPHDCCEMCPFDPLEVQLFYQEHPKPSLLPFFLQVWEKVKDYVGLGEKKSSLTGGAFPGQTSGDWRQPGDSRGYQ